MSNFGSDMLLKLEAGFIIVVVVFILSLFFPLGRAKILEALIGTVNFIFMLIICEVIPRSIAAARFIWEATGPRKAK
jgi:hypothetical protein